MNRQQALNQLRIMQAWHEDFGNGPCPDYEAICYAIGVIETQPEELDTLIKALEQEHKKLREMQEAQSGPHWIPVTVINQNYIPELKDFPYDGLLFTYRTPKGKLLVREAWVERGRIIGKKMNGVPIAYQQKPEPWEGDAE